MIYNTSLPEMSNGRLINELHKAIRYRDINLVRYILKKCKCNNVNILSTSLYLAVSISDIEMVKLLLEHGADILKCKNPPLHKAASLDNTEIAKLLIDSGADIEQIHSGNSPLYISVYRNNKSLTRYLLKKGVNCNRFFLNYYDVLYDKISDDMYKIFIDFNIDLNIQTRNFETPLHYAIKYKNIDLIRILLDNSIKIDKSLFLHKQYLIKALKNNCSYDIIALLIKHGVSINEQDDLGKTPLHHSVINRRKDVIKILLNMGADINVIDDCIGSPLHYAVSRNDIDTTKILLERGANVNIVNDHIDTVLNTAVASKNKTIVNLLLKYGADTKLAGLDKYVIHIAIEMKDINILNAVLLYGCDVNVYHPKGFTPLYMAVNYIKIEFVKLLLEHGAYVNAKTKLSGNTPLHKAMFSNSIDNIKLLLSYGADYNSLNNHGNTPLTCVNFLDDKIAIMIISKMILERFKNPKIAGLEGFVVNMEYINSNKRLLSMKESCEKELDTITHIKLNSTYSLNVFLDNNINVMTKFVNNPRVNKIPVRIRIYRKLIQKNKLLALHRYQLIVKAVEESNKLGIIGKLPVDIKHIIMELLSDEDLHSVITSCYSAV
ncbi:ankyrin repeat containing protein [Finch poxvirus]|uniref:Ankyrin repeat containing protein n=1 Tax=Condorpox virus TaxID=3049970 RepID=A0AAT9UPE9_9POXV|nr:ankyrin repeat containing protein [Finch poxvirus]